MTERGYREPGDVWSFLPGRKHVFENTCQAKTRTAGLVEKGPPRAQAGSYRRVGVRQTDSWRLTGASGTGVGGRREPPRLLIWL